MRIQKREIEADRAYTVRCPFIVDSTEIRTNKGYETVVKNVICKGRTCAAWKERTDVHGNSLGFGVCGAVS